MSESTQDVSEEFKATRPPAANGDKRLSDSFWTTSSRGFDGFPSQDERLKGEVDPGLVSLTYIKSAIRRTFRLWFTLALVGFMAGVWLYVRHPAYEASTSLILTQPPNAAPGWIADDQAIAQSRTVAGMALRNLRLRNEKPADFAATYTVVPQTDRVLVITLKARSQTDAVREARAVAAAFLAFRTHLLTEQDYLDNAALRQQVNQNVNSVDRQLAGIDKQISGLPVSSPKLKSLEGQRARASAALDQLDGAFTAAETNTEAATTTAIKNSGVLDPAAMVKVSKKRLALFVGGGLLAGLLLGLGSVVINAIVSTRLRRRDEVSHALGAPVRLSIRKVRPSRIRELRPSRIRELRPSRIRELRPGGQALLRRGLDAARDPDLSRVVDHLGSAASPSPGGFASLAVVPVETMEVAASCLASLAALSAQRGLRVVLADLYSGAPAARILGVSDPGISEVTVEGSPLVVMVPNPEDAMPAGPLERPSHGGAAEQARAACESADLVLTFAELDPALGGDYLADWATSVVAVITAGRSSAERIRAVGQMVRLAGITQLSAVLLRADWDDETIGVAGFTAPGSARLTSQPMTAEVGDVLTAADAGRRCVGERSSQAAAATD
jgi:capsular polysaccharide biosynthesis protein